MTERNDAFTRFMGHVEVGGSPVSCWFWRGNKPDGRYGHFCYESQTVKAHRWIYELLNGPIPEGMVVRHKCDNPWCVKPSHLEIGTPADNIRDKYERGRNDDRKGENHPLARLHDDDIRRIRKLASVGMRHQQLAQLFGMSRQYIGKIVRRQNWKHIP